MRYLKILFFILIFPLLGYTSIHKYYISVTQIDYIKEKKVVQITSRIFIDDFENVLKENYDENIILGNEKELEVVDKYIERYLKDNIIVNINGKSSNITFIGKEYDDDIVRCYLEIEGVKKIKYFQILNTVLFDLFEDQQNIVKIKMNSKQKSFMLTSQKKKGVLSFD